MRVTGRYQGHPVFTPPSDLKATVWRYLDFTKLVSLLETRCLFFARADSFDDPFEGSYSRANVSMRPEIYGGVLSAEALAAFLSHTADATSQYRRWTFISCWNLSDRESAALWRLYTSPTGGVAVRSTFERLAQSFGSAEPLPEGEATNRIYLGRVHYLDYEVDVMPEVNTMWPFVHKRHSFEFENEVRAVVQKFPHVDGIDGAGVLDFSMPPIPGLEIEVDLETLIQQIHVSPTAPAWFFDLVRAVVSRYGLGIPVRQSAMSGSPVY